MDAGSGLIVVERIAWPQNSLREMLDPPPWDAWAVPRDRIILALHMYVSWMSCCLKRAEYLRLGVALAIGAPSISCQAPSRVLARLGSGSSILSRLKYMISYSI